MARLNRQESQLLTRRLLRSAARSEFAARGVGAASIDRITEAAGFSRGAFYANYKSKRELLLELLAEDHEQEITVWKTLVEEAPDIDAVLPELERRFNDYAKRRDSWMLSAELQLEAERDPEFGAVYLDSNRTLLSKLTGLIESLQDKAGRAGRVDAEIIAAALRSLSIGLMFESSHGAMQQGRPPGRVLTLFLRSILNQPEESPGNP